MRGLKQFSFWCFTFAFCTALTCNADNVTGNGQWETVSSLQSSPDINWCTAGSAGCLVNSATGTMQQYVGANGATATNMGFLGSSQFLNLSVSFNSTALGPGTDTVGFYVETQTGKIAGMIPLFSTASSQNSNVLMSVSNGAEYGFYVENQQGQNTTYYFMNSGLDKSTGAADPQYFSLFNSLSTDKYLIGFNSHSSEASVFNSLLITASYAPATDPPGDPSPSVPEPASTALAGVGLCALGLFGARRLRKA